MSAWFYILRLRTGRLYPGSTTDLDRRLGEHLTGKGGRTTALDPPAERAYYEESVTFCEVTADHTERWRRSVGLC
jgi:predicted GIY-YIG superfamily endonuclease